jgi:hypothetical protein
LRTILRADPARQILVWAAAPIPLESTVDAKRFGVRDDTTSWSTTGR